MKATDLPLVVLVHWSYRKQENPLTVEETREKIIAVFESWPSAKIMRRSNSAGFSFFIWLQSVKHPILEDGNFGEAGDPLTVISDWIDAYTAAER